MDAATDNLYMTNLPSAISEGMICDVFSQYGKVVQCKVLPNPIAGGSGAALVRFGSVEEAQSIVMQLNGTTPVGFNLPVTIKFAQQRSRGGGGSGGRQDTDISSPYGGGTDIPAWGAGEGGYGEQFNSAALQSLQGLGQDSRRGGGGGEEPGDNLYIRGLPEGIDEPWLKEALNNLAPVISVKVLTNPSPDGTCAALVRFESEADAARVIQLLNGQSPEWCTQRLLVKYANRRNPAVPRGGGNFDQGGTGAFGGFGGLGGFGGMAPQGVSAVDQLLMGGSSMEINADFLVKMVNEAVVLPGAGAQQHNSEATVYVAGLPGDTVEDHVYQMFSPLGAIFSVFVKRGGSGSNVWAIAFVNFVEPLSAQAAIAVYNGMQIPDGSMLKVRIKDEKPGNRGGSPWEG